MNDGWIKLYKKFLEWKWYNKPNDKALFIHCLLSANWKDKQYENLEIKRGSFATTYKTLSIVLGISIQNVRTSIRHLISTQEITLTSYSKFIVISVNNYDMYQVNNTMTNNELTRYQHATNMLLTTIEENKNIDINIKRDIYSACAREGIVFKDGKVHETKVEVFDYDWMDDNEN